MSDATPAPGTTPVPAESVEVDRRQSLWRQGLEVFAQNRLAVVGALLIIGLVLFCFLGPLLRPTEQVHTDLASAYLDPGAPGHWLGTDGLGYDQLGRLMLGGQTSIIVGLAAGLLATLIGTIWGAVAGFLGGWIDAAMMRVVDALMSIPALFLFMLIATMVTPTIGLLILIIGAFAWLNPARLVRGEAIALRSREYILAMRGMGGGPVRAVRSHIVRNAIGTVIVNATFQVADAVLYVAYLSFLGLGVPPPAANWGGMLSTGISEAYSERWWLLYPPGILIIVLVLAFNFVGDGLRDAFEVRLRKR
ncbi:peptide/nickel transport system permease protein [Propionibacteriaceae bacterium ES.041]|uniref:ABC transporter permease n=1 Tax=Enemella evansiae TaxID=2016499 RepID=UPI000B978B03|nr:ABC transporter permease [Enemella evansiae]OYN97716.1 peptide ABC transporter permease [Enemella evansiae]PFG65728.1 peptide/nickel transport system permease protein [Propionibacteriaceae bacterium ES.041]TDO91392.1 peptide/nickel transport system permease protein [Enemella evansiae]